VSALLPLPVLLPLLGAALALLLGRHHRAQRVTSVVVLAAVVVIAAVLLARTAADGTVAITVGGWPSGIGISLVTDRLSALMLLTSTVVTLVVMLFSVGEGSASDDEDAEQRARDDEDAEESERDGGSRTPVSIYHPTYLILSAGVSIAFLAGDLFNLFVGFEVLLAASYVLLTLGGTKARIAAGTTYILVALLSSFVFLTGLGLVYAATGTLSMAELPERLAELPPSVSLVLHLVLLTAFGIKAAVFPLSAWLPDSYPTAPAPVTAVFAGLLTKVGVYAIFRTQTLLFPSEPGDAVSRVLLVLSVLTMVVGALGAIAQRDLKRVLSFTLVSHIGYMIFGVALGTELGLAGAIFYVVHHIVVQTALFLVSGLVEERAGTTSLERLGGLAAVAPGTAVLFLLPALNLAGIPPFSGFIGKVVLLRAGVDDGGVLAMTAVVAAVVTSLLTLLAVARVWAKIFWSGVPEGDDRPASSGAATLTRRLPRAMVAPTAAVVALTVAITAFAGPITSITLDAARDITGTDYVDAVTHGGAPDEDLMTDVLSSADQP
jgi:multicomponent Na+:H+ antiporter subunit D